MCSICMLIPQQAVILFFKLGNNKATSDCFFEKTSFFFDLV